MRVLRLLALPVLMGVAWFLYVRNWRETDAELAARPPRYDDSELDRIRNAGGT